MKECPCLRSNHASSIPSGTSSLPIGTIEKGLPGANAGSLVAGLGGATARTSGDGVAAIVGGSQALAVVVLFLLVFGVAGGLLLIRRDVH